MAVDLNVDLGETAGEPDELYGLATQVNVACGGHAGDEASMRHAVREAKKHGCAIAAHPSYPDRGGFGRRSISIEPSALVESLRLQCLALDAVARVEGARVVAVKPHGALYHDASRDDALADALVGAAVAALGARILVVGPPAGALMRAAARRSLRYAREGFADRGYRDDGTLVPRTEPGALLLDPAEAAAQAVRLAASGAFDTICLHADTRGVLERARAVSAALAGGGWLARLPSP